VNGGLISFGLPWNQSGFFLKHGANCGRWASRDFADITASGNTVIPP
jgi:hypothetical protein